MNEKTVEDYMQELAAVTAHMFKGLNKDDPRALAKEELFRLVQQKIGIGLSDMPVFMEVWQFRQALSTESERGCALLAASHLEGALEMLLRRFFVDDKKVLDELLEASRPLGTFSGRIDVVYALGLIPKITHRDLHIVRRIRNDFGHTTAINFEDEAVANRCKALSHSNVDDKAAPRRKFVNAVMGIAAVVHAAIVTVERRAAAKDHSAETWAKEQGHAIKKVVEEVLRSPASSRTSKRSRRKRSSRGD